MIDHHLVDEKYRKSAFEITEHFDPKDTPFIALALKFNAPIWTNDKKLIEYGLKTKKYLPLDTRALENLLRGKSLNEIIKYLKEKYLKNSS